ncbi:MAG: hypothetical protein IPL49_10575 [Saprospirales bacterium]|nr:hypothetical protein [Saprospirales bacterium]
MQKVLLAFLFSTCSLMAFSQHTGPRLFWDIPNFYAAAPDISTIENQMGLGIGTAFNVATFWGTSRVGGGTTVTLDPKSADIGNSFLVTPYMLLEGGAGIYRSNGNQCAQTKHSAFTAMAVLGLRYDIDTRSLRPAGETNNYGLNYVVGAELGYFYIRNMLRNTEIVLRGNYFPKAKIVSATFGFKFFLNIREMGRY